MTEYHTIDIDGLKIFYREAGRRDRPTLLLLHGFPASSFMYRELLDRLADRFHLVAPDYPGFGHSDAPSPDAYPYTFDALARTVVAIHRAPRAAALRRCTCRTSADRWAFVSPARIRRRCRSSSCRTPMPTMKACPTASGRRCASCGAIRRPPISRASAPPACRTTRCSGTTRTVPEHPARVNPDSWVLQQALLAPPGQQGHHAGAAARLRQQPGSLCRCGKRTFASTSRPRWWCGARTM